MVFFWRLKANSLHVVVFNLIYISSHKHTILIFWSNFRNRCGPPVKNFAHPGANPGHKYMNKMNKSNIDINDKK